MHSQKKRKKKEKKQKTTQNLYKKHLSKNENVQVQVTGTLFEEIFLLFE